jgi:hypothetical protein
MSARFPSYTLKQKSAPIRGSESTTWTKDWLLLDIQVLRVYVINYTGTYLQMQLFQQDILLFLSNAYFFIGFLDYRTEQIRTVVSHLGGHKK